MASNNTSTVSDDKCIAKATAQAIIANTESESSSDLINQEGYDK